MRKMLIIAVREYLAAVRTKAFIISVVFLPLMMGTSIGIQIFLEKMEEGKPKTYAVVDRTPGQFVAQVLKEAEGKDYAPHKWNKQLTKELGPELNIRAVPPDRDVQGQRYELSEEVRQGKISGFLEVGADVERGPSKALSFAYLLLRKAKAGQKDSEDQLDDRFIVRYQSKNPATEAFPLWAEVVINTAVMKKRCLDANVPENKLATILQHVRLVHMGLSERNRKTGEIEEATPASVVAPLLMPVALMTILFMMIMVGATPLMQGVVEEKALRIAEVLLGSIRPFPLMLGKLLGTVGVSITMAAVYLGAGYWAARYYGLADYVSVQTLVWFVIFQTLAVLMYGSVFVAIGAACTDLKETQTMMWPIVLIACIPMFMASSIMQDPNSRFVAGASFVPPFTPMLMLSRLSIPPGIPWWQPLAGVVGVLLATLLCVYAAGRIFRVGLLMQGKGAKVSDMVKWVFRG